MERAITLSRIAQITRLRATDITHPRFMRLISTLPSPIPAHTSLSSSEILPADSTESAPSSTVENGEPSIADPPALDHPSFKTGSQRRLSASPTLPLEGVSISEPVQKEITKAIKSFQMRPKYLRKRGKNLQLHRARETYREKRNPYPGQPTVLPPPQYTQEETASFLSIRFPGTFAANVYALAEVRRVLPSFAPTSVLDYGASVGTSLMAASRVMSSPSFADRSTQSPNHSEADLSSCVPHMPIKHAWLIDYSPPMKPLATSVLRADVTIQDRVDILQTKSLSEGPPKHRLYDLVCASYSLSELVRSTIVKPDLDIADEVQHEANTPRNLREKVAEVRIKKLVRSLWNRTAPGGLFVIIEDGTAAGFETVLFARQVILNRFGINRIGNQSTSDSTDSEGEEDVTTAKKSDTTAQARVIAPCMHSKNCPLDGSVSRHRICQFVQRLNRPPFQREALPTHNGFEDEYFSFVAIQKVGGDSDTQDLNRIRSNQWGRLVRPPLMKKRHVALDVCTPEAKLERRIVSKKQSNYSRARRSKWGDIWPEAPDTEPSPVNF